MRAVLALVILLGILTACTSQGKIDAAVVAATGDRDARIAELESQIATLATEKQTIEDAKGTAVAQQQACEEKLAGTETAMDDCTEKATVCWHDREQLEIARTNLTKKIDVLQGWVDVCQKTLDKLG